MQVLRVFLMSVAISACGGRTGYEPFFDDLSTGGSPASNGTGGTAGFSISDCPPVRFRAVSTPGYQAQWCLAAAWMDAEVLDIGTASGSLGLTAKTLQCDADDCDSAPIVPWSGPKEYIIDGVDVTWTGLHDTVSTCGESARTCSMPHCASVGRYVATLCGYVNPNPEWIGGCAEANDQTPVFCGASEFDFPANAPVIVTLRPPTR